MEILKEFIRDLKMEFEIEEIISEYVKLDEKKWGLCPFHQETVASFHVVQKSQYFYCFGCKAGGDLITFLQKIKNLSFFNTLRYLSKKVNLPIPSFQENSINEDQEIIQEILNVSIIYFHKRLNSRSLEYLHSRGLDDSTIADFLLGFDDGSLKDFLLEEKKYEKELVLKSNLIKTYNDKIVDYFKDMITLPNIIDGEVKMITGRNIGE